VWVEGVSHTVFCLLRPHQHRPQLSCSSTDSGSSSMAAPTAPDPPAHVKTRGGEEIETCKRGVRDGEHARMVERGAKCKRSTSCFNALKIEIEKSGCSDASRTASSAQPRHVHSDKLRCSVCLRGAWGVCAGYGRGTRAVCATKSHGSQLHAPKAGCTHARMCGAAPAIHTRVKQMKRMMHHRVRATNSTHSAVRTASVHIVVVVGAPLSDRHIRCLANLACSQP
jgi:hypothetical protein